MLPPLPGTCQGLVPVQAFPHPISCVSVGCCSLGGSVGIPLPLCQIRQAGCDLNLWCKGVQAPSPASVQTGWVLAGASVRGTPRGAEHHRHQFVVHWGPPQPSWWQAPTAPGRLSFPGLKSLGGQSR